MMATRVSDTELAARLRQRNRVNSERRRERLAAGGMVQLLAWIPATLRRELDSAAAARGEPLSETTAALLLAGLDAARHGATLNETAERLLLAGLNATTPANNASPADNPPVLTTQVGGSTRDALMNEVAALLDEGLSGAEVARQLTAAGYRSPNGAALAGPNLLRDFRLWQKRQGGGAADTTGGTTSSTNF